MSDVSPKVLKLSSEVSECKPLAVGTRLLQHALNEGAADGFIADAYLHVQTNNDDAIKFYTSRLGFKTDTVAGPQHGVPCSAQPPAVPGSHTAFHALLNRQLSQLAVMAAALCMIPLTTASRYSCGGCGSVPETTGSCLHL